MIYVSHTCKNMACQRAFIDEDLTNAQVYSPNWKYCPECVEKEGFINPEKPPERILSEKQKEVIRKYSFKRKD